MLVYVSIRTHIYRIRIVRFTIFYLAPDGVIMGLSVVRSKGRQFCSRPVPLRYNVGQVI